MKIYYHCKMIPPNVQICFQSISQNSILGNVLSKDDAKDILCNDDLDLLDIVHSGYAIRKHYFGNDVHIHVINNVKNGSCPEDCRYCVQSKPATSPIDNYPQKSNEQILNEAKIAYESGAFRYCMVLSGRGPTDRQVDNIANLIKTIKSQYAIQVCLSAGLINDSQAKRLKAHGLDRLNHNLNTSRRYYPSICSTHSYDDRLTTLQAAKSHNLDICSGMIVGMGESHEDVIDTLFELRKLEVPSIPINFYIPLKGAPLAEKADQYQKLTPAYCLRVLSLARMLNPCSEIRIAAGRELHLASLQPLSLYLANSLFVDGYLNSEGSGFNKTLMMIRDLGFVAVTANGENVTPSSFKLISDEVCFKRHVQVESSV